ncbi:hypothetical protein ACN2WE_21390 [Streptomyces sp. cg28]|uniref:hypothetical protein n=1 Tax=Streptomyces sp. cg28 TaxID=3403457 RepID=UPI003B21E3FF
MIAAPSPEADERRVRHLLVTAGVGPDAEQLLPALPATLPPGYEPAAWSWDAYFAGHPVHE